MGKSSDLLVATEAFATDTARGKDNAETQRAQRRRGDIGWQLLRMYNGGERDRD